MTNAQCPDMLAYDSDDEWRRNMIPSESRDEKLWKFKERSIESKDQNFKREVEALIQAERSGPKPTEHDFEIDRSTLENLHVLSNRSLSLLKEYHTHWHQLMTFASKAEGAEEVLARHTKHAKERFVKLQEAVNAIASYEFQHPLYRLYLDVGGIEKWYRASDIFATDLHNTCQLLRIHTVRAADTVDFAQYVHGLLSGRPSVEFVMNSRQDQAELLGEMCALILDEVLHGPDEALYYATHITGLMHIRFYCIDNGSSNGAPVLHIIRHMNDLHLLHGAATGNLAERRSLPEYWNFVQVTQLLMKSYRREVLMQPVQPLDDRVKHMRAYLPKDLCHRHRFLDMIHTYQRLAFEEVQAAVELAVNGRLPTELSDVVVEKALQVSGIPADLRVYVRSSDRGIAVVGDWVEPQGRFTRAAVRELVEQQVQNRCQRS